MRMHVASEDDLDLTAVGLRADVVGYARKARAQRPWLVIVSGSSGIGRTYRLEHRVVLGRSRECDVQVDETGVSRRHAAFEPRPDGSVDIVDLESRNGTFVNGAPVSRATLRDGDKIQIGDTTILKLSYQDELDEALQRNLYESATRDPLTRTVNKRGFEEAFAKEHAFARRHGSALSLLVIDADHFKRVNDTHGHAAGDHVLRRLAEIVGGAIRSEDMLARIGGEEFVVVLRDVGLDGAVVCAERVRSLVEGAAFEHDGARIPVTISVGVAALRGADVTAAALLADADHAVYEAKRAGRNRVAVAPR